MGRVRQGVEQREEGLFLLRELGIEPLADLVVVLEAEDHIPLDGVFERARDAFGGAADSLGDRQARVLLPAERAAVARAGPYREIDGALLPFDVPGPFVLVRMSEVGREAHHRRDLAGLGHRVHDRRHVALVVAPEKLVIVLDALTAERRRVVDPGDVVPPTFGELVNVALGEDGDRRNGHRFSCAGRLVQSANQRTTLAGLR